MAEGKALRPFLAKQTTLAFIALWTLGVSLGNSWPGAQLGAMLPGSAGPLGLSLHPRLWTSIFFIA